MPNKEIMTSQELRPAFQNTDDNGEGLYPP